MDCIYDGIQKRRKKEKKETRTLFASLILKLSSYMTVISGSQSPILSHSFMLLNWINQRLGCTYPLYHNEVNFFLFWKREVINIIKHIKTTAHCKDKILSINQFENRPPLIIDYSGLKIFFSLSLSSSWSPSYPQSTAWGHYINFVSPIRLIFMPNLRIELFSQRNRC